MHLLYYTPECVGAGRLLWQVNKALCRRVNSSICRDMENLRQKLQKLHIGPQIVILLAASSRDLKNFITVKQLLHGLPIILILPDRKQETITLGHCLSPRFLSYVDSDFTEVTAVVMQMIRNNNDKYR